ncbi:hypothetical protein F4678DRAFT_467125 [Xylaria arbuscula]|nr:hypothetical protein F4678DRAFT_467125 [Xylaria arbuscula]
MIDHSALYWERTANLSAWWRIPEKRNHYLDNRVRPFKVLSLLNRESHNHVRSTFQHVLRSHFGIVLITPTLSNDAISSESIEWVAGLIWEENLKLITHGRKKFDFVVNVRADVVRIYKPLPTRRHFHTHFPPLVSRIENVCLKIRDSEPFFRHLITDPEELRSLKDIYIQYSTSDYNLHGFLYACHAFGRAGINWQTFFGDSFPDAPKYIDSTDGIWLLSKFGIREWPSACDKMCYILQQRRQLTCIFLIKWIPPKGKSTKLCVFSCPNRYGHNNF